MTREEFIKEKLKAIGDINAEILDLKGGSTPMAAFKIYMLEVRKLIIASQPIPKFPKGSSHEGGSGIVGEQGPELIQ